MITGIHARLAQLNSDQQTGIFRYLTEAELGRLLYLRHDWLSGKLAPDATPTVMTVNEAISYCEELL